MGRDEERDGVPLTNLDQPLFEGADATKRDLVDYLDAVSGRLVPELADRPLSVVRVLRGQKPFMQKNVPKYTPSWVRTVPLWAETSQREVSYALCNDRRTLLWFANQRAVEYHPTLLRIDPVRLTHLVLDIDPPETSFATPAERNRLSFATPAERNRLSFATPAERNRLSYATPAERNRRSFADAVRAAGLVREALTGAGLAGAVKTSGSKGVHVFVPLAEPAAFEDVAAATRALAARAERLDPELATTAYIREDRGGKVFLDAGRAGGASVAAVYSPRVRPGTPVSFPVPWDDLDRVSPGDFTLRSAVRLLGDADPWASRMPAPQALPPDLVAEGHTIPVARVQAMHEGKRRRRAARQEPES